MSGVARGRLAAAFWVLVLSGLCALPALAQDEEFVPEEEEASDEATDFSAIDDMLKMDEEVLSDPATYSYDPSTTARQILQLEWQVYPAIAIIFTQNGDDSFALDFRLRKEF